MNNPSENEIVRLCTARDRSAFDLVVNRYGRPPATLDDLVPAYIDSVPYDRFNGESLGYDSERMVIYSSGLDFTDDGGGFENNTMPKHES